MYLLFFLFIQSFSAIEIRLVFSRAKLMISSLQWLEKRWGVHACWRAIAIFQLIAQYQGKFQFVRARGRAN